MILDPDTALARLPSGLRAELLQEFSKISRNYREGRWEAAELDGGRFSEVAYTVLAGYLDGDNFAARASKPNNFERACTLLGQINPATYSKSARVTVPRVLVALYDFRNNRGVGHVGGDVNANHMDAEFVLHAAQWVMAEFVRLFHGTDLVTATAVVEALVERTLPLIWEVGQVRRILDSRMSLADGTLLLLYASVASLSDLRLAKDLEQQNLYNYKRVLKRLHAARMIEYVANSGTVTLSPLGVKFVEERLLSSI
ncbi:hypothetical protein [Micromonospora sp. NBC_01796]|uniref:hypothetical protein n=1 Tax=Micromonospora sp. NBC_01796 TaxID=2975987 RepID=UPI002DD9DB18|nr:hypothetical protein [Micromonospora sp. NBC_01796]WSA88306.1 hypothetical protein OIE47_12210 [Micromonospora sp. NBC_01796]